MSQDMALCNLSQAIPSAVSPAKCITRQILRNVSKDRVCLAKPCSGMPLRCILRNTLRNPHCAMSFAGYTFPLCPAKCISATYPEECFARHVTGYVLRNVSLRKTRRNTHCAMSYEMHYWRKMALEMSCKLFGDFSWQRKRNDKPRVKPFWCVRYILFHAKDLGQNLSNNLCIESLTIFDFNS